MSFVSASLTTAPLQQQTLTPQQQYALKLLHMNASELLAEAERAAEENPLIECEELERPSADTQPTAGALHEETEAVRHEGESIAPEDHGPLENTYTSWTGSGAGDPDETPVIERVAAQRTLREDLLEELGSLPDDPKIHPLVGCLIEELDDSGFLTTPLAEVAKSYLSIAAAPAADWQKALALLQTFDPPGVGASSPTEALILQVERRITEGTVKTAVGELLVVLLKNHLRQIAGNDRRALLTAAKGDETLLQDALALLQTLDPHPASEYAPEAVQYVIADIQVRHRGNRWEAMLNPQAQPAIRLSSMAQGLSVNESSPFGHYLAEARRLISGIEARQSTLLRTAQFAVDRQQAFFSEGRSALVPLAISEAAGALGVADSTVSRAVSGKFFQCPLGVFELRSLFMPPSVRAVDALGISQAVSPAKIRARICTLIADESPQKRLSDQALTELLNAEGFDITRRTVAKYRDLEGIPTARLRGR